MISRIIGLLTLLSALGSGVVGGVFFAFSSFVLPALARLPGLQGLTAMQSINIVVLNRSFLGTFVGTAFACAVLAVDALARWSAPGAKLRLAGALMYVIGSLLVTKEFNVPWNDALAATQPHSRDAARSWASFVSGWSFWNHVRTTASILAAALLGLAASGCSRYWECAPPAAAQQKALPERLSQTGLYRMATEQAARGGAELQLAGGVQAFTPQFELWSDGASKRRWVSLPAGERIDTSDMENWIFPVGTQLWKEFTVSGVRVETRLLRKIGAGSDDWATQAYVWLPDGSDALATPGGASNIHGTAHDVPSAGECRACHGGRKSFALGFSAVQLAHTAALGELDLVALVAKGRLSQPPRTPIALPGDAGARSALGYLHANCGHCHNQDRPAAASARCYDPENDLDFWLSSARLAAVKDTPTYRSGLGLAFEPGDPDSSRMLELMSNRGFLRQMPPLGTEAVDARGLRSVHDWVATLD